MVAATNQFDIQDVAYVVAMDQTVIADLGVNEPPRVIIVMASDYRHVRQCESMEAAVKLAGEISRAANCPLDIHLRDTKYLADCGELKVRRLIALE